MKFRFGLDLGFKFRILPLFSPLFEFGFGVPLLLLLRFDFMCLWVQILCVGKYEFLRWIRFCVCGGWVPLCTVVVFDKFEKWKVGVSVWDSDFGFVWNLEMVSIICWWWTLLVSLGILEKFVLQCSWEILKEKGVWSVKRKNLWIRVSEKKVAAVTIVLLLGQCEKKWQSIYRLSNSRFSGTL